MQQQQQLLLLLLSGGLGRVVMILLGLKSLV
jgi:hypothetical protein